MFFNEVDIVNSESELIYIVKDHYIKKTVYIYENKNNIYRQNRFKMETTVCVLVNLL